MVSGVGLDHVSWRPLDGDDRAREQFSPLVGEPERVSHLERAQRRSLRTPAHPAGDSALESQMRQEEASGSAVPDRHAAVVAQVVLGVPGHEDPVTSALDSHGFHGGIVARRPEPGQRPDRYGTFVQDRGETSSFTFRGSTIRACLARAPTVRDSPGRGPRRSSTGPCTSSAHRAGLPSGSGVPTW